jgi:hypothetical protein
MLFYSIKATVSTQELQFFPMKDKHTLLETMTLSVAIIIPFALFILTGFEVIISKTWKG